MKTTYTFLICSQQAYLKRREGRIGKQDNWRNLLQRKREDKVVKEKIILLQRKGKSKKLPSNFANGSSSISLLASILFKAKNCLVLTLKNTNHHKRKLYQEKIKESKHKKRHQNIDTQLRTKRNKYLTQTNALWKCFNL